MESGGYQVLELHGESLLKDYMDVELWVCPRCGRIAFFMREKDRKDRYRAECGGRTDEELSALLESPDAPALLRDAAREVLDSRAEWKAAEHREGRISVQASCVSGGRTPPEQPATSGTGSPVTADTSGANAQAGWNRGV